MIECEFDKQVIVVDDGSDDQTSAILRDWVSEPGLLILHHPHNRGKGAAVRTGLDRACGEITVIQDADLEYDPADWPLLIAALRHGGADVVYGSRYLRPIRPLPWSKHRLAVCLLNLLVRLLYGRHITDEATCYKALRTEVFRALNLQACRFELCAEITTKVCRLRLPLIEVPISYRPRSCQQGKKIGWRDVWPTFWTLCKWRFAPFRPNHRAAAPDGELYTVQHNSCAKVM